MLDQYQWARDHSARLDELDATRDALRDELHEMDHCPILKRWGRAIESRGVLRKGDGLRVELCYPSAKFGEYSSGGAYCDGIYYVIIHRNGATSRATLMMRACIGTNGGVLAYHRNDDGAARLPLTFITETTLPDGARKLINDAIQADWVALQVSPVDIWRECLAMQLRANLSDMSNGGRGSQWRVVNMINAHGGW
jgi:hypothetical protein